MKRCSIEGCTRGVMARGWCGMHYMRWRSKGDPNAKVRMYTGESYSHIKKVRFSLPKWQKWLTALNQPEDSPFALGIAEFRQTLEQREL